jgi:hypothetical protein
MKMLIIIDAVQRDRTRAVDMTILLKSEVPLLEMITICGDDEKSEAFWRRISGNIVVRTRESVYSKVAHIMEVLERDECVVVSGDMVLRHGWYTITRDLVKRDNPSHALFPSTPFRVGNLSTSLIGVDFLYLPDSFVFPDKEMRYVLWIRRFGGRRVVYKF